MTTLLLLVVLAALTVRVFIAERATEDVELGALDGDALVEQTARASGAAQRANRKFGECEALSAVISCGAFEPELLGFGSFGQAWLVEDLLGRKAVLKLLHNPDRKSEILRRRHRMIPDMLVLIEKARDECAKAQELAQGPGRTSERRGAQRIMRCLGHNMDTDDDRAPLFLLLEYSGRTTLTDFQHRHVKAGTWTMSKVRQVAKQVLEGLAYLESFGEPWIHHDIKPDNVVIKELGVAAAADEGAAAEPPFSLQLVDLGTLVHHSLQNLTWCTPIPGTEQFAPPEWGVQAKGDCIGYYDPASPKGYDMYAWGVMLFHMVSGLYTQRLLVLMVQNRPEDFPGVFLGGVRYGSVDVNLLRKMIDGTAESILSWAWLPEDNSAYHDLIDDVISSKLPRSFFERAIRTLSPEAKDRPTAEELLQDDWLRGVDTPDDPDRPAEAAVPGKKRRPLDWEAAMNRETS